MHTQVLGITTAAAFGLLLLPSAAAAQSAASADQGALTAYRAYLTGLAADAHSSSARDTMLVDGVDNTCAGGLSDLNDLTADQLKASALTDFADEVDADLALAYLVPTKPALTTFAAALTTLNWPTATQQATTTRLITAERAMLTVVTPDLCADATTLDAAPLSEPRTTSRFLVRYRRASAALHTALVAFQTLLANYETTSEYKLVTQINTLVGQFSSASGAAETADAAAVLSDLGVSDSSANAE